MFVTTFYGVLDPATGRFRYANAGHNPPYRLAADATVTTLAPTGGMALGALGGLSFAEREQVLRPGERLLFYTDGATEALDPAGEEFTTARLEAVLAARARRTRRADRRRGGRRSGIRRLRAPDRRPDPDGTGLSRAG